MVTMEEATTSRIVSHHFSRMLYKFIWGMGGPRRNAVTRMKYKFTCLKEMPFAT